MPVGDELYIIARDVLKALAKQQVASWFPDLLPKKKELEPLDPTSASLVMTSRFIPYITGYIEDGGRVAVAEIGQQLADDWLVQAPEVIDSARAAALDLCEETVQTFTRDLNATLEGIRGDVSAAIQSGETAGDTVNRVAKWIDENSRWRARRIAVTESARAYNQGQLAATQGYDFVAGYELLLSSDACPLCHAIHRQCPKIPKGGSFGQNGNHKTYKDLKLPPFHPNCVLGETPVNITSLVSVFHAKYQGPVVRIVFSDGSSVSVTANHMLLTPSGFARAIDLVKGDHVVSTGSIPQFLSLPSGSGPNVNGSPATAEQIFRSLLESGCVTTTHVPMSPKYLHGDAAFGDGQIDIIRPNSFLRNNLDALLSKPSEHIAFVPGRQPTLGFNSSSDLASLLDGLRLATDGGVSSLRELKAILWGCVRHSLKHGLGSVSRRDAHLFQPCDNCTSRDTESIRNVFDRFSSHVPVSDVVDIEISTPHEPISVYDFETNESTYIIGNGIVSSNCRCTLVTVFDDEVPDRWPAPVKPGENGYIVPNETDYENAAEGGYESVAIGNAKSLKSFITLTDEVDNGQV